MRSTLPDLVVMSSASDRAAMAAWDATETSARIARNEVSGREVLEAAIERSEEADHLGAVFARAYDRARSTTRDVARDPSLAGVPTFVKDMANVGGVPITWGTRGASHCVSSRTDAITRRIEEIGLVILGKSACPELGLSTTTEPVGWPPCRNPWDLSRSSGGSSGGAAVLVAAGVVPIAHGTDAGGSIRIPAACCGLVGLKPSRHRLDVNGSNLLPVNVVCEGVLTRTVRDTVAFFAALESRRAPRKVPAIGSLPGIPCRPLHVGVFVNSPVGQPVDPEVRRAVLDAARLCASLGHRVDEIECPFDGATGDDFLRYMAIVAWLQVKTGRWGMHPSFDASCVDPWTVHLMQHFTRAKLGGLAAIFRLRRFARAFRNVISRFDVLMSPTLPEPAPPLGHLAPHVPFADLLLRMKAFVAFTQVYNVAGAPAVSLPLGRSSAGLPVGVQLAAAHGHDRVLLDLAKDLETARPWNAMAPPPRGTDPARKSDALEGARP